MCVCVAIQKGGTFDIVVWSKIALNAKIMPAHKLMVSHPRTFLWKYCVFLHQTRNGSVYCADVPQKYLLLALEKFILSEPLINNLNITDNKHSRLCVIHNFNFKVKKKNNNNINNDNNQFRLFVLFVLCMYVCLS